MSIKLEGNPDDMTQGVAGLSVQNSSKCRIKKIHEACVSCSIKRLSVKREGTCFKYQIRDHNREEWGSDAEKYNGVSVSNCRTLDLPFAASHGIRAISFSL